MKEEIFIEILLIDGDRKNYRDPSEGEIALLQEIFPGSKLRFSNRSLPIIERIARQAKENVSRRYPQDY